MLRILDAYSGDNAGQTENAVGIYVRIRPSQEKWPNLMCRPYS
jgi:hypothetical protein